MVDVGAVLRRLPLDAMVSVIDRVPGARAAADPFVAGQSVDSAVTGVAEAMAAGMSASVQYLPTEQTRGSARLVQMRTIEALVVADLSAGTDLAVSPADLGLGRGIDGDALLAELAALCSAAADAGMTVTFTSVPAAQVPDALGLFADLAGTFPDVGITVAAHLRRSEADCVDLSTAGARVRLVRRGAAEPNEVAYGAAHDIDRSYVRCARALLAGQARPIIATADPILLEIAAALAQRCDRESGAMSYQFRRGLITDQADELVAAGCAVSVLVPFGPDWSSYLAHHVSPSLAALGQAARSAATTRPAS